MIEGIPIVMDGRELRERLQRAGENQAIAADKVSEEITGFTNAITKLQAEYDELDAARQKVLKPFLREHNQKMVEYSKQVDEFIAWKNDYDEARKARRHARGFWERRRVKKNYTILSQPKRKPPIEPAPPNEDLFDLPKGIPTRRAIEQKGITLQWTRQAFSRAQQMLLTVKRLEQFYAFRAQHVIESEQYKLADKDLMDIQIHPSGGVPMLGSGETVTTGGQTYVKDRHRPEKIRAWLDLARRAGVSRALRTDLAEFLLSEHDGRLAERDFLKGVSDGKGLVIDMLFKQRDESRHAIKVMQARINQLVKEREKARQ